MAFFDNEHKKEIERIEGLWAKLEELRDFAKQYGIDDIFQDNGAKVVQQLIYLYLNALPGREGNNATSRRNPTIEWEMKSINLDTTASGFSTNHHLNTEILQKYRRVPWSFAIYHGITLEAIYVMNARDLEPYFQKWEEKLRTQKDINNPKINVNFVRENGTMIYPIHEENPIDPDSIFD